MKLKITEAAPVEWIIFMAFLGSRCIYYALSGADHFELFGDSYRYDDLSNRILNGDFNLDIVAFIIAPLYPALLAVIKVLAGTHWEEMAVLVQFLLVSMSGLWLYRLALLLFEQRNTALLAAAFYGVFPNTLWLNFTLSQETVFQSLFVGAIYYWVSSLQTENRRHLVYSAVLYSLAFLTKSHVLLFSPLIAWLYMRRRQIPFFRKAADALLYAGICILFTLPYGLYHLKHNGQYVISSTGFGAFFHQYHSEAGYMDNFYPSDTLWEQPHIGNTFVFYPQHDFGQYGKVNLLPHRQKQKLHFAMALEWIKSNPGKYLRLKWFAFRRFFTPGLSRLHYPAHTWLLSLLAGLPFYLLAYAGLWQAWRDDIRRHTWMAALTGFMLFFYLFFWPQSRFRTVTLEPFYLMYAALAARLLWSKWHEKSATLFRS